MGALAVHGRGIIHRDIKPANFLCTAERSVKLTDFSLAQWLDPNQRSTLWQRLAGTPHYMSPEQCREQEYGSFETFFEYCEERHGSQCPCATPTQGGFC